MISSTKKGGYSKKSKTLLNLSDRKTKREKFQVSSRIDSLDRLRGLSMTPFLKMGGHLGRPRIHRSQRSLCIGQKNGIWIYDGEVIKNSLRVGYVYLKYFMDTKKPILVINQEESLKEGVKFFCEKMGLLPPAQSHLPKSDWLPVPRPSVVDKRVVSSPGAACRILLGLS